MTVLNTHFLLELVPYFQKDVARALGVHEHKVVVSVKRIGGGFGGKETAPSILAVPVAVAAQKLVTLEITLSVKGYNNRKY